MLLMKALCQNMIKMVSLKQLKMNLYRNDEMNHRFFTFT